MIFSKLSYFTKSYRSTTIIFRTYAKKSSHFQPLMMPKDNKQYLIDLQKQRCRQKAQVAKYSPSHIFIQVISNGTRAESRSVLVVTDHTNYMFNCGEGTQRLAAEHHARLTKIEHIFVTQPTWENMGGIPGVALTIQDTGVPKVNIHGPEGTIDLIQTIDNFVTLNQLAVLPADTTQQFSDQTMTINYISIKNPNAKPTEPIQTQVFIDNVNYYDYQLNANGKRTRSPNTTEKTLRTKSVLVANRIDSIMIFVCKVHPRAGALDIEKCLEAGVPSGPLLGKLKAGQDVTLPNGTIVKGKDVVSPSEPGPLFIVMECPDEDWIDAIIENPAFLKYQQGTAEKEDEIASYIVHFTPTRILNNPKFKDWLNKFGPKTQHLIINEDNKGYASEAMHKMQHQLHLLHPTIFPFFHNKKSFVEDLDKNAKKIIENEAEDEKEKSETIASESEESKKDEQLSTKEDLPRMHQCETLHMVHLRPNKGLQTDLAVKIYPEQYVKEAFNIDGFLDSLADLQTELNTKTKALGDMEEYPKILMLGTGSSIPNKSRNTSGILLQLDKDSSIILDCGEATVGQIFRFFGEKEGDRILKSIKAIYVSHLHADHHLGLIGILKQREKVTKEPVFILAPNQIISYLHYYHNRFEPIIDNFRLISNRDLLMNQNILSPSISKDFYEAVDISNVCTTFATHCPFAYAVALTLKDGRKIVYSGDTVPCENLIKISQDSFLLIHEATMEDGLESEALIKRHSTISQAINIGVKANANFTLLTHFSQRYCKIPILPCRKESGIDFSRVGIAYDFMHVSLSQLPLLPLFYDSLGLLFGDFRAMLEERASKREWKKEFMVKSINN